MIVSQPTTLFPLWNYDNDGRDVGKCALSLGFVTNQNRMAIPTWSFAMEKYPPFRIVEIGAYNGGFTCALGVHAYNIGAKIYSFDRQQIPGDKYRAFADFLGISWFQMDCFSAEAIELIKKLVQSPGITYLLCDGGNKAREINTFAPFLKPGDVVGGHDYFLEGRHDLWGWTELTKEQVTPTLKEHDFEPFMQEFFDVAAWLVFRKRI